MDRVVTLISNPAEPVLDDALVDQVARAVSAQNGHCREPSWLADQVAAEIVFSGADPTAADDAARAALREAPIDIVVRQHAGRRKSLLIADMDSTVVTIETLDEVAALAGLRDQVAAVTARAMAGELEFRSALRERVRLMQGLPVSLLEQVAERIEITPGAATLVATMRANGGVTALASGGFLLFVGRVAEALGFDFYEGNDLEIEDGKLTGYLKLPILNRDGKVDALLRYAGKCQVPLADTLAVGDGANDLGMLKAAGVGVAFHAKPAVACAAGARIDHGDLTALLYLQGYRASEFVTPDEPGGTPATA